jgi:hypothetical protein
MLNNLNFICGIITVVFLILATIIVNYLCRPEKPKEPAKPIDYTDMEIEGYDDND